MHLLAIQIVTCPAGQPGSQTVRAWIGVGSMIASALLSFVACRSVINKQEMLAFGHMANDERERAWML